MDTEFKKTNHPISKLESILKSNGNNYEANIKVGGKILTDHIESLQDILEQYNKINPQTRCIIASDITETNKDFRFVITHWSNQHGTLAVHCLESIPTTGVRVVIPKES